MNAEISFKLFELTQEFIKDKKKAKEFVSKIEQTIDAKFEDNKNGLATKEDIALVKEDLAHLETKISNRIYIVGLIQFLAIVGSILAIVNFMLK